MNFDSVMALALFTLGSGIVIGVVSYLRAQKAQDDHEDAAVAERQRMEDAEEAPDGSAHDQAARKHPGRNWEAERNAAGHFTAPPPD